MHTLESGLQRLDLDYCSGLPREGDWGDKILPGGESDGEPWKCIQLNTFLGFFSVFLAAVARDTAKGYQLDLSLAKMEANLSNSSCQADQASARARQESKLMADPGLAACRSLSPMPFSLPFLSPNSARCCKAEI